ncbi:MAG: helix-turn-helix domain-containing protein [Chthoniobacterales bacterium]
MLDLAPSPLLRPGSPRISASPLSVAAAHVRRLRKKLGKRSDAIETVRGFGYRIREDCGRPVGDSGEHTPPGCWLRHSAATGFLRLNVHLATMLLASEKVRFRRMREPGRRDDRSPKR